MKDREQLETYQNYMTIAPIPEKVLENCKEISCEEALELGRCYFKGIDVEKDYEKAVGYYRQAADEGIADAYFILSLCYKYGKGVEADANQEKILLEKGAEIQRKNLCKAMELEELLADSKAEENEKASMDLNPKKPENYLSPDYKKILFKGSLRVCSPHKVRKIIFSDSFASNIKKQCHQDISQKQDKSILGWAESSGKEYIVHIEAEGKIIAPEDCSSLFEGLNNVREIEFGSVFDTRNTHSMKNMFHECSSLESIDLSGFVTENVTDMSYMFHGCKSLKAINVNGFATHNVTSMAVMFAECGSLESLDVSGFATQNVVGMCSMFYGCMSLKQLDVSKFATANVTNMYAMFYDCAGLESLDVSGFNTENVTDMSFMFGGC